MTIADPMARNEYELAQQIAAEFSDTPLDPPYLGERNVTAHQKILILIRYLKEQLRDKKET